MPTTYDVLLSYDINTSKPADNIHSAIKQCMIDKGYADRFKNASSNRITYLPNTTLWKKNINSRQARTDIEDCINVYNKENKTSHKLERFIATQFPDGTWASRPGKLHTSNSTTPIKPN